MVDEKMSLSPSEQFAARKAQLEEESRIVASSRVLLVGAGGIGCELLKNLVLSEFNNIEVFDLDTIEVSNLNRQFLFQRHHVGQPKCEVAKSSALQFNPNCNITTHHDSIINDKYGVNFFKQFNLVLNALDNRAARNHVNRMCLAADVPLIESGSAGFFGQVYIIKKGISECYECIPKADREKSYPSCTVRNTPSEPIHCIVWGKNLFCQLFGEVDADNEVSPDTADPEAAAGAENEPSTEKLGDSEGRVSTRTWAEEIEYDPKKLLKKFFIDDVNYLLTMKNLWSKRKAPVPVEIDEILKLVTVEKASDTEVWDLSTLLGKFARSVEILKQRKRDLKDDKNILYWDKDDDVAIDFTTSAANIRCRIFDIAQQTRFNVKSMAGNIIPAIATTNAVVAGLIVIEARKALCGKFDLCRSIFLKRQPAGRKGLVFSTSQLHKPNPKCYVCSSLPEVTVKVKCNSFLVRTLEEKVLKKALSMVMPDVEVQDGKGTIILSSEAGETDSNLDKTLSHFGIQEGTRLRADDFFQNFTVTIIIVDGEVGNDRDSNDDQEFQMMGDAPAPKTEEPIPGSSNGATSTHLENTAESVNELVSLDDEDDDEAVDTKIVNGKRSADKDANSAAPSAKKPILDAESDDELVCLD